eukprot:61948_1
MKRTLSEIASDCEEVAYPTKKRRKLNHDVQTKNACANVESTNTSNTNTSSSAAATSVEERNVNDEFTHTDVAFYLNKSPFIANGNKHQFNKYAIGLDEIIALDKNGTHIEKCIIFSYMVDPQWILNTCPILTNKQQTEQLYILHGQSLDDHYDLCNLQSVHDNLRIFKIKMIFEYGTHHTKMIFICYKNEGIRVVITTANMIEKDWYYKCNGIFIQDFPLQTDTHTTSEFGSTLYSYCNKIYGLSNRVIMDFSFLHRYDFSSAKVLLIPSVPGYHKKDDLCLFGHKRLQHLLAKYKVSANQNRLVLNCSSIGSITEKWLKDEFYMGSFGAQNGNNLRLIWPSVSNVCDSIEGYQAGGCLCLSSKCCKAFLFQYFSKWNGEISGRQRLMPHIKTYSVVDTNENQLKMFVLTSANLSTAAWGIVQKHSTELFIRSFEIGCLYLPQVYLDYVNHKHRGFSLTDLPFKRRNVQINNADTAHIDMDEIGFEVLYEANKVNKKRLRIVFPIPMEIMDAKRYGKEDTPWVWDVIHSEQDLFGRTWP